MQWPLGVVGEFKKDNLKLSNDFDVEYIKDSCNIENYEPKIYLTNYERIRKGDIDASKFCGVCFDEASNAITKGYENRNNKLRIKLF